jgi:hypothetical protein
MCEFAARAFGCKLLAAEYHSAKPVCTNSGTKFFVMRFHADAAAFLLAHAGEHKHKAKHVCVVLDKNVTVQDGLVNK